MEAVSAPSRPPRERHLASVADLGARRLLNRETQKDQEPLIQVMFAFRYQFIYRTRIFNIKTQMLILECLNTNSPAAASSAAEGRPRPAEGRVLPRPRRSPPGGRVQVSPGNVRFYSTFFDSLFLPLRPNS